MPPPAGLKAPGCRRRLPVCSRRKLCGLLHDWPAEEAAAADVHPVKQQRVLRLAGRGTVRMGEGLAHAAVTAAAAAAVAAATSQRESQRHRQRGAPTCAARLLW